MSQWRQRSIFLSFLGAIVLLTTHAAAELSVWIGDFVWGHLISSSVFLIATIYWNVMNHPPPVLILKRRTWFFYNMGKRENWTVLGAWGNFRIKKCEHPLFCGLCFSCEILCQNSHKEPYRWSDRGSHLRGMCHYNQLFDLLLCSCVQWRWPVGHQSH